MTKTYGMWNSMLVREVDGIHIDGRPVSERRIREAISLADVMRDHAEFSQETFGADADVGPIGPVKHLGKEVKEILAKPDDTVEYVDALFLVSDAIRRHLHQRGISFSEFVKIAGDKLDVLKSREWPEPKDGEPRMHIKAEARAATNGKAY